MFLFNPDPYHKEVRENYAFIHYLSKGCHHNVHSIKRVDSSGKRHDIC